MPGLVSGFAPTVIDTKRYEMDRYATDAGLHALLEGVLTGAWGRVSGH